MCGLAVPLACDVPERAAHGEDSPFSSGRVGPRPMLVYVSYAPPAFHESHGTSSASAPSDTAEARRAAAEEFLTAIPVVGEVDDLHPADERRGDSESARGVCRTDASARRHNIYETGDARRISLTSAIRGGQ